MGGVSGGRRDRSTQSRRSSLLSVLWVASLCFASRALADEPMLPAKIQAVLMAKFAGYDRTLLGIKSGRVMVAIVAQSDPESAKVGAQVRVELQAIPVIADLPHEEIVLAWSDPGTLARTCEERGVSILYVAPGFHDEIPAIVSALGTAPILTVGANPSYVPRGIVLGFDLVSGHPKLVVNLTQARKQGVELSSQVLKLARVIE
jgi:hypothetical protein